MDPVALCVLGTLAAFNHKSQDLSEWAEEVLYAMVRGGFLTTMYNQEIPATINVPGVRNPFKPASKSEVNEKIQTQNKTVAPKTEAPQTQTTPPVVSEVKEEETAKEPEKTETETI